MFALLRALVFDVTKLANFCDRPGFPFDSIKLECFDLLDRSRLLLCDFSCRVEECDRYVCKSDQDQESELSK